jgi:hypothetical protein
MIYSHFILWKINNHTLPIDVCILLFYLNTSLVHVMKLLT